METTIQLKSNTLGNSAKSQSVNVNWYDKIISKLDFSYFGLISMTILIGSIIGGIAASSILSNDAPIWQLCLCAAVSMANNTAGIAQAPTRWVANLFAVSTIVNVLLILINLI